MAAAASNQPGAQNGPLVFMCVKNPQTNELQPQLVGFRNKGSNGLPAWERIVYREYVDLKKKWRDFGLASYMDPKKLEHLKYQWKPLLTNNGRLVGYETVWIHTNSELKRRAIPVIILQPSWGGGVTLYIVEDSVEFLKLSQGNQQAYIQYVATWWTSADDGFARIKQNEAAANEKITANVHKAHDSANAAIKAAAKKAHDNVNSKHKGQSNNHQPGASNQGGRRTRRTRRK